MKIHIEAFVESFEKLILPKIMLTKLRLIRKLLILLLVNISINPVFSEKNITESINFTDDLNDFSMIDKKSSNMMIDTINPGNFNNDGARCARTNTSPGYIIYKLDSLSDFSMDFWIVDEKSGNLKVYSSEDENQFTEIETKLTGPIKVGYRSLATYRSASEIPRNTKYLKIEISGGDAGWKGQIGSVSFINESELRKEAKTFYFDSQNGSDDNPGNSPSGAWRTLEKLNAQFFIPGDSILLKSGSKFYGSLKIQGNGTKDNPVYVGKYGGENKPLLDAAGYLAGINLENAAHIYFNDLEITSDAKQAIESAAKTQRYGVYVTSTLPGEHGNLQFNNLDIHHIFATENVDSDGQYPTSNMGMGFNIEMKNKDAVIKNIRIEDCRISMVGHTGIKIFGNGSGGQTTYLDSVFILNNHLEHIGGPGMVPGRCSNVLVSGNTVNFSGSKADPRMHNRGSGIWPWTSKNVVIEKNKFMNAWGKYDSCGAHIDFNCSNVIVQYNFSYHNAGGFVEILGNNVNCAYRYNVSINDGYRLNGVDGALADGHIFWVNGYVGNGNTPIGANNNKVYNNTIYVGPDVKTSISISHQTHDNQFENNIIYVDGEMTYDNQGKNNTFDNNLYFGNIPEMDFGKKAIFTVPLFVNAGDTMPESYKITEHSLAFGTGKSIADNLEYDFWGKDIPNSTVNRGADQTQFDKSFYIIQSTLKTEGGNIYPDGELQIPENVDLPIRIVANPGYFIQDVVVDNVSIGTDSLFTFKNLSANHALEVEFFAPADSVFDPLDNFNFVTKYSNFRIQTDNTQNFFGDAGRAQRNNTDPGTLIYNFKEISFFEIDFWSVNNDNTKLSVFVSEDGKKFSEIAIKAAKVSSLNNRKKTTYIPVSDIPEGTNFIKFELSEGSSMWQGQIGSIKLKWWGDEKLQTGLKVRPENEISIFPNPVNNTIKISGLNKSELAEIYSIEGALLHSEFVQFELDASFLDSGIYFLKIDDTAPIRFIKL